MLPTVSSFQLVPGLLPLELEVGLFHLSESELNDLSGFRLQLDHAVGKPQQRAFPAAPVFYRLTQKEFRLPAGKSFEVPRLRELSFQTRRTDLQSVTFPWYDVFHVEDCTYLLRNELAFLVRD